MKKKKLINYLNGVKVRISRQGKVTPTNWKIAAVMLAGKAS